MWFLYNGLNECMGRYKTQRGLYIAIGKLKVKLYRLSEENNTELVYKTKFYDSVRSDI